MSCSNNSKLELQGSWTVARSSVEDFDIFSYMKGKTFHQIDIVDSEISILDRYQFVETGHIETNENVVKIKLNRNDKEYAYSIKHVDSTTVLEIENEELILDKKVKPIYVEEYSLINIPTNTFMPDNKISFSSLNLHLYKSEENRTMLRRGLKEVKMNSLHKYIGKRKSSSSKNFIFLGKGISLTDLKNLYYQLAIKGRFNVQLITKREGFNKDHIFQDVIEIWRNDIDNKIKHDGISAIPEAQIVGYNSSKDYLKDVGELVEILNSDDLKKISNLGNSKRYVVSIDSSLSIEDYIKVKALINEKRQTNRLILTEIKK